AAVEAVRQWHERTRPGPLVLLPCAPGPRRTADGHPLADELRVDGPAAAWVRALLAGHEVLDGGRALRRANGAVFLTGAAAGGPRERRAELGALAQELGEAETRRVAATTRLEGTLGALTAAEAEFAAAGAAAERARAQQLEAGALKGDAERAAAHTQREAADATAQVERLSARLAEVEARLATVRAELERHEVERVRLDERLGALDTAAREAGAGVEEADARLAEAEAALEEPRKGLDVLGAEEHKLEVERTEILGRKRGLVERVEAEWRKPLDQLLAAAPEVPGDIEWLRQEDDRLRTAIDAVGPVNALAVEEHGEETKRLEFLM